MEINVGVASNADNTIPEFFGEESLFFMRYLVDSEDGAIYTRSTCRCSLESFLDTVVENNITYFVYNTMPAECEEALKAKGVKLFPNVSGNTAKEAVAAVMQ